MALRIQSIRYLLQVKHLQNKVLRKICDKFNRISIYGSIVMATRNTARSYTSKKLTAEQVAENMKAAAKRIRESSRAVRESVKTLRESGAVQEMADATHEAALTARDTTRSIRDTVKDV